MEDKHEKSIKTRIPSAHINRETRNRLKLKIALASSIVEINGDSPFTSFSNLEVSKVNCSRNPKVEHYFKVARNGLPSNLKPNLEQDPSVFEFSNVINSDSDAALNFCVSRGLIPYRKTCSKCCALMDLVNETWGNLGYSFFCPLCITSNRKGRREASLIGTFFQGCCYALNVQTILDSIYNWAKDIPTHPKTTNRNKLLRDLCISSYYKEPPIGGLLKTVSVDICLFYKGERFAGIENIWIVGGLENNEPGEQVKCFLEPVFQRAMVLPIVLTRIASGTEIITNEKPLIPIFDRLPEDKYTHKIVNDRCDELKKIKKLLKLCLQIPSDILKQEDVIYELKTYLAELIFKQNHKTNAFNGIISLIAVAYPGCHESVDLQKRIQSVRVEKFQRNLNEALSSL